MSVEKCRMGSLAVDEVENDKLKNNDCFRNLHLISHFVTASPQGEAFKKFSL